MVFVEIDNCFESAQVLTAKIDRYVRFCQRKVKDADGKERPGTRRPTTATSRPPPLLPVFNCLGPRNPGTVTQPVPIRQ
ncbi:hypothetical protein ABZ871_38820 [Streptomyces populi]